ncbi:hypothetical protein ABIE44_000061 [Marmoricola sp. OAE513]|uniref:hypothetical protein n=1 Tax=Marmoricola sp. OAE513 TaxID=2817894 RepID=UPI001AE64D6A
MPRILPRILPSTLLALALLLASACGEEPDGRLSVAEVTERLQTGNDLFNLGAADLGTKVYSCIARALVSSDLTDKGLEALVDGDQKYVATDAEATVLTELSTRQIEACKAAPSG